MSITCEFRGKKKKVDVVSGTAVDELEMNFEAIHIQDLLKFAHDIILYATKR